MNNEITTIPAVEAPVETTSPTITGLAPETTEPMALAKRSAAGVQSHPLNHEHPVTVIDAPGLNLRPRASAAHVRNGKIARLPRLKRDLVNRMLFNNLPYGKIVGALDEFGILVTERNISNWKTRGGYKEWCAEQERQLQLSLLQDHLTDYLRKNDATQLPEVGLQVASTQLSLMLLRPEAARDLAADPKKYSQVVDMLCRLSTHIQSLQKDRRVAVQKAAIKGTPEYIKREEEKAVESVRSIYTSRTGESVKDPDVPHRNDLPRRDELPFRDPAPPSRSLVEFIANVCQAGQALPARPAPHPKPAENPAAETQ